MSLDSFLSTSQSLILTSGPCHHWLLKGIPHTCMYPLRRFVMYPLSTLLFFVVFSCSSCMLLINFMSIVTPYTKCNVPDYLCEYPQCRPVDPTKCPIIVILPAIRHLLCYQLISLPLASSRDILQYSPRPPLSGTLPQNWLKPLGTRYTLRNSRQPSLSGIILNTCQKVQKSIDTCHYQAHEFSENFNTVIYSLPALNHLQRASVYLTVIGVPNGLTTVRRETNAENNNDNRASAFSRRRMVERMTPESYCDGCEL
ncbi:hypothetical protein PM082_023655 [Marasmius tenuissimus]|nr:hypothetical protein PM082_023655 [Marasmius tenuissimus]